MSGNASPPFRVVTSPRGSETVLFLRGRVANAGAFQLGALLDAAIDRRPESITLDLSELEFIGTAGIVAEANAEKRLAEMGAVLTLRSPSGLVNRLLAVTETPEMTRLFDPVTSDGEHLQATEESEVASLVFARGSGSRSAEFRRVTSMPSDPLVIDGALRLTSSWPGP